MQMQPLWDNVYYRVVKKYKPCQEFAVHEEICLETDLPPTEQSTLQIWSLLQLFQNGKLRKRQTKHVSCPYLNYGVSLLVISVGLGESFSGPSPSSLYRVTRDTKAFLKLLYPNKLYKRSVKSKFDLLGTKAGQDTQGSHPRATDRKYRKTGGQKCNRKGHKGHVDLQHIMAAISHDSHIVCTVLKSQSRLCQRTRAQQCGYSMHSMNEGLQW